MAQDTVTNLAEITAEVNALDDKIDSEVERVDGEIGEINGNLANLTADGAITSYDIEEGDVYINYTVGADSVRKKLGSVDYTIPLTAAQINNESTKSLALNPDIDYLVTIVLNWNRNHASASNDFAENCTIKLDGETFNTEQLIFSRNDPSQLAGYTCSVSAIPQIVSGVSEITFTKNTPASSGGTFNLIVVASPVSN